MSYRGDINKLREFTSFSDEKTTSTLFNAIPHTPILSKPKSLHFHYNVFSTHLGKKL